MNKFEEKIVGYETVVDDLMGIIDIIKNPEIYRKLGAEICRGVILEGDPGTGKTLMGTAFLEECGLPSFTVRRNTSTEQFIEELNATFKAASEQAPSVILLDDIDKMAPKEKNSEEYSVLQALIDSVHDKQVFIIATANCTHDLPESLTRAGRFDRWISFSTPSREDGEKIVKYYISKKPISDNVNLSDVAKMLSYKSCAAIDSVINLAAIEAGRERCSKIEMRHLVNASLTEVYGVVNRCDRLSGEEKLAIAYHEAGHAVVSDVLLEGSVGLVSICSTRRHNMGGFMLKCLDFDRRAHLVLVSLAGKAGYELHYGKIAPGTKNDLAHACDHLSKSTKTIGTYGVANLGFGSESQYQDARSEVVVNAELERYIFKAKEILAENCEFLDKLAAELIEKETLLNSDIARIRATCTIKPAIVG